MTPSEAQLVKLEKGVKVIVMYILFLVFLVHEMIVFAFKLVFIAAESVLSVGMMAIIGIGSLLAGPVILILFLLDSIYYVWLLVLGL